MAGGAIVILTDPAQCELADAETLVQAILQIQQLNSAGLATSQAFCDHPAAAVKFLEAYSKAYPELQERSSELPPPDFLHSVIADGRLKPLQPMPVPDGAKPDEGSKNYPLYVLSLGAPEVLIRAMDHNRYGTSEIKFVEIASPENEPIESMSVAAAVNQEAVTRPSWHPADSGERRVDDEYFPSIEPGPGSSDPLKLESVEIDLDHIGVERQQDVKVNQKSDQPALVTSPVNGAASHFREGQQSPPNEASSGSSSLRDPLVQTAPPGVIVSDPDAKATSQAEAVVSPSTTLESVPLDTTALNSAGGGEALEPIFGAESERAETETTSVQDAQGAGTANEGGAGVAFDHAEHVYEDDASAAAPANEASTDDDTAAPGASPLALNRESAWETTSDLEQKTSSEVLTLSDGRFISQAGEDVIYPPNDSFAGGDVIYPSAGSVPDGNWLDALFGGPDNSEVVDLDSLLKDLPGPTSSAVGVLGDLQIELMQVRGPCRVPSDGPAHSRLDSGAPAPPPPDARDPDEQSDQHLGLPVVHELDI